MTELNDAMQELRKWQRHWLLRQYGDDGNVLPENLALSKNLDTVLNALAIQPAAERAKVIEECAKHLEMCANISSSTPRADALRDAANTIRAFALPAPPPAEGGQKG